VEYVGADTKTAKALCEYCRDDEPCPLCKKPAHKVTATLPPLPRLKTKPGKVQIPARAAHSSGLVSLAEIIAEAKDGIPQIASKVVHGITVGYPVPKDLHLRPGPTADRMKAFQSECENSPTGAAEFFVPKGTKLRSFQSSLAAHLRKRSKSKFSLYVDNKKNTVIVIRKGTRS